MLSGRRSPLKKNKGFTLIELLVVIAIIALLIGILLPAIGKARDTAKNVLSQTRMRQLGQGASNYSADNKDRIFSYTWKGGPGVQYILPDGTPKSAPDDTAAAELQNTEILQRVTGRTEGEFRIDNFKGRLPHRRYSHIVLLDYLTNSQPEPVAASPFDRNLLQWQENPTDITAANNIPYAAGSQIPSHVDTPSGWTKNGIRQRWPFASSYQTVPAAWNTDGINRSPTYAPLIETPHLMSAPEGTPLGGRRYTQVAHPSGKVLQFEEFDRFSNRQALFYFYPEASSNITFFDGSVRRENTADANPGWNPMQPEAEFTQIYLPLHTFPDPKTGPGENDRYCTRYRWTRYGLQGIDFGAREVGRPRDLGPEEQADCGP